MQCVPAMPFAFCSRGLGLLGAVKAQSGKLMRRPHPFLFRSSSSETPNRHRRLASLYPYNTVASLQPSISAGGTAEATAVVAGDGTLQCLLCTRTKGSLARRIDCCAVATNMYGQLTMPPQQTQDPPLNYTSPDQNRQLPVGFPALLLKNMHSETPSTVVCHRWACASHDVVSSVILENSASTRARNTVVQ